MALSPAEQHVELPLTVPHIVLCTARICRCPALCPSSGQLVDPSADEHMSILVHLEYAYVSVLSTDSHLLRCSLLCARRD